MKRYLITLLAAIAMALPSSAQLGIFNHLGADVSVSTTGIGVELSTNITDFVQMRAGMSFVPNITFTKDIDGTIEVSNAMGSIKEDFTMDIDGKLKRSQGNVIFNVYPFGRLSSFFIAGGAYFGGKTLIDLSGHSDKVAELQQKGILKEGWVELGDYKLDFEKGGNIYGGLVTKNFRPYLGLGFGRPCPGSRLGFMFELGVQFTGKLKVCQGKNLDPIDISNLNNDDDWQKLIDKLQVYPVLKFTLCGHIL